MFSWLPNLKSGSSLFNSFFGSRDGTIPSLDSIYENNRIQDALVLDIEASGLKTGLPVVEAAVYNLGSGKVVWRRGLQPYFGGQPIDRKTLLNSASEPWFQQRAGTTFSWVGNSLDPKNNLTPQQFLDELSPIIQGKDVYIQNAPFESKMLGAMISAGVQEGTIEKTKADAFRSLFETRPASEKHKYNLFWVTGKETQEARQKAYETKDWSGVFASYMEPRKGGGTSIRDIQDITRSILSNSQKMGLMQNLDSYVGANVNMLSLAYGMGVEKHTAAADTELEGKLLSKLWRHAQALNISRNDSLLFDAKMVFNEGMRENLTAFKRLDSVRQILKERAVKRSIAQARMNIEFLKEPIDVVDKFESYMAPVQDYQKNLYGTEINYAVKRKVNNLDEAIDLLRADRFTGSMDRSILDKIVGDVRVASQGDLHKMIHYMDEDTFAPKILESMNKAGSFNTFDALGFLAKKYPRKMAVTGAVAGAGLLLGGASIEVATHRTSEKSALRGDSYVNWSGLEIYGIGSSQNTAMTDFGSGWRGLEKALTRSLVSGPKRQPVRNLETDVSRVKDMFVDQLISKFSKTVDTGDYVLAGSVAGNKLGARPSELHIVSRVGNKASPRLKQTRLSSFKGDYNTIEGMGHRGIASLFRKKNTDFGSGYKGTLLKELNPFAYSLDDSLFNNIIFAITNDAKRTPRGVSRSVEFLKTDVLGEIKDPTQRKEFGKFLTHLEKRGISDIGLVRGSLGDKQQIAVGLHEAGHSGFSKKSRKGIASASKKVYEAVEALRHAGKQRKPGRRSVTKFTTSPETYFEELYAQSISTVEETKHGFRMSSYPRGTDKYDRFTDLDVAVMNVFKHVMSGIAEESHTSQQLLKTYKKVKVSSEELSMFNQKKFKESVAEINAMSKLELMNKIRAASVINKDAPLLEFKGVRKSVRISGLPSSGMSTGKNKIWTPQASTTLFEFKGYRESVLISGLPSSGMAKGKNKIWTPQASPTSTRVVAKIAQFLTGNRGLAADAAETLINNSEWKSVGTSRFLVSKEKLGSGGFGDVFLSFDDQGKASAFKQAKNYAPTEELGSFGSPRQILDLTYNNYVKLESVQGDIVPASAHIARLSYERAEQLSRQGMSERFAKIEGYTTAHLDTNKALGKFTGPVRETVAVRWAQQEKALSTAADQLDREVNLTKKASEIARQRYRSPITKKYVSVSSPKILAHDSSTGTVVQELVPGQEYKKLEKTLSPSDKDGVRFAVEQHLHKTLEKGGVFPGDLSKANIMYEPKTRHLSIIDHGSSVEMPSLGNAAGYTQNERAEYVNDILDNIFGAKQSKTIKGHSLDVPERTFSSIESSVSQRSTAITKRQMTIYNRLQSMAANVKDALLHLKSRTFRNSTKGGG